MTHCGLLLRYDNAAMFITKLVCIKITSMISFSLALGTRIEHKINNFFLNYLKNLK